MVTTPTQANRRLSGRWSTRPDTHDASSNSAASEIEVALESDSSSSFDGGALGAAPRFPSTIPDTDGESSDSASASSKDGGLATRIRRHLWMISSVRSCRRSWSQHYTFAGEHGAVSAFFALAQLPRLHPDSREGSLQIKRLMQIYLDVVRPAGTSSFADFIQHMRWCATNLPQLRRFGLNTALCLNQGYRNEPEEREIWLGRGPCFVYSKPRGIDKSPFFVEGEASRCGPCYGEHRKWTIKGKEFSIAEQVKKRQGCAQCGAKEWGTPVGD
jgi:hypothetical protein